MCSGSAVFFYYLVYKFKHGVCRQIVHEITSSILHQDVHEILGNFIVNKSYIYVNSIYIRISTTSFERFFPLKFLFANVFGVAYHLLIFERRCCLLSAHVGQFKSDNIKFISTRVWYLVTDRVSVCISSNPLNSKLLNR